MQMKDTILEALIRRRSIRAYKDIPVSDELIQKILEAALLAPSSKNRQPWKFIVVSEKAKDNMLNALRIGFSREKETDALLPQSRLYISAAEHTLKIMNQAPVSIFVMNTLGMDVFKTLSPEERIYDMCNIQSIGAAIENMSLAAVELGLGSLWICDIFFAYKEIVQWLDSEGELCAALSLGYADECPYPRPRKKIHEVVEWRKH